MSKDPEDHPNCINCKITIYHNVAAGASVLPVKGNKVLLAVRSVAPFKGTLDTIGGFLKPDETFEQAALREAKEETGLEMKLLGTLGNYPDKYDAGTDLIGLVFIAEITSHAKPRADDDVAALKWFPITEPPITDVGFESARQALGDLKYWYLKNSS